MTANPLILAASNPLQAIAAAIEADPRLISEHTKRQYLADLRRFETFRAGRPLTKTLVEAYAASLIDRLAPATVNQALASIRWWARKVSDLAADHAATPEQEQLAEKIGRNAARVATIRDVTGEREQAGRYLDQSELAALLAVCDADPEASGFRDAALLAVAWSTGLRRDSLASLTLADVRPGPEAGSCDLKWRGKGRKEGTAYLYNGGYTRLQTWLARRGDAPGPIFCQVRRGEHIHPGKGLSGESLRLILEARQRQAGLQHLAWHDFRRTFISRIIEEADLSVAQQLALHKSSTTTQRYDRRPEYRRREAVRVAIEIPL